MTGKRPPPPPCQQPGPPLPLGLLPPPVLCEDLQRRRAQGDRRRAALRLRVAFHRRPPVLNDRLGDGQLGLDEVDPGPRLPDSLTAAQTPERDQMEQGIETVRFSMVEELADLNRRPYHDP